MSADYLRPVAELDAVVVQARPAPGRGRIRSAVNRALHRHRGEAGPGRSAGGGTVALADWPRMMQQVIDAISGQHTAMLPVRDEAGAVVDLVFAAVTGSVVDLSGRQGAQLAGRRVSDLYPALIGGPVWQAWVDALADGQPREVGPVPYIGGTEGTPAEMSITVAVQPVGPGLLNTWIRHDEQSRLAERIAQTERLGNLGWAETDLVTGTVAWSDELYRIYGRDPALGPMTREEQAAVVLPEDQPITQRAAAAFGRGETVDVLYRIRVGDQVRHLRGVVDAERDARGRTLKLFGIVQDVTARETNRVKLAAVEQQLREHQRNLAAEHRLAAQLQQIVLPIPAEPIDLAGLRVAIRYLPAEQASHVGGDWYHAAAADDGSVVLAVGDVAGHGIRAAAVMAQLRHAISALTVTTTDPAILLSHLNRLLQAAGPEATTATAVVGRFDPATRTLCWAQAGHLPPLVTRAGVTTQLPRPRGPLLGALADAVYASATLTLDPGDLLIFYTDGLVEHREHTIEEGLAPIIARLNSISSAGSQRPLVDLLAALRRANPEDDTCILAARLLAS